MKDTLAFIGRLSFWLIIGVLVLEVHYVIAGDRPGYIRVDVQRELRDIVPSEETLQTIVVERDQLPEGVEAPAEGARHEADK